MRYSNNVNKKLFVVAIAIGILLAGAIVCVLAVKMNRSQQPNTQTGESAALPVQSQDAAPEEDAAPQPLPGTYKDYNAATVSSTKGTKVLFFHAQWCPQCRQLDSQITTGPIPENVTIFKVNYDTSQDLRQKYGVTLQTTFVKIDDAGNAVKKYVAYDEPTLAALIRNIL